MDANTEKLIRELADRLGTTADHLWGVLIKQATIVVVVDVLQVTALGVAVFFMGKYLRSLEKLDWDKPGQCIWRGLLWCVPVVLGLVFVSCFMDALAEVPTCIFNPEYWALKQLIKR